MGRICTKILEQILPKKTQKNEGDVWALSLALIIFIAVIDSFTGQNLPYYYFVVLRFFATAGFVYILFRTLNSEYRFLGIIPVSIAAGISVVLYNPIFPFSFPREIWTGINIATGLLAIKYWSSGAGTTYNPNDVSLSDDLKNKQTNLANPNNSFDRAFSLDFDLDQDEPSLKKNNDQFKEPLDHQKINQVCSLIVEPLMLQRAMIETGIINYLKSYEAIGYVSGYTDQFLQRSSSKLDLSRDDEETVMALVMGIVFEGTGNGPSEFYNIQKQNIPEFQEAQTEGARNAIKMLTEGGQLEAGMGWFQHAQSWKNAKENLSVEVVSGEPSIKVEETLDEDGDQSFFDYFGHEESPHVKNLRSYFLMAFGTSQKADLPINFAQNEYIAGFSVGFFSIVLDAVKDGLTWTTEKKGQYGITFFMELFNDESSLNLKSLRDKAFASELSKKPKFSEGREHGSLLAAAHYKILKKDLSEPLIDACRNLSNSAGVDMQTAVFSLTLQPYIISEWPQEIKLT